MINASFVTCLCEELNRELSGGRIDKIQQPARDVVLLTVRTPGENRRLLLSASPGKARIHLTALTYENPSEPPLFVSLCLERLLRYRFFSASPSCPAGAAFRSCFSWNWPS